MTSKPQAKRADGKPLRPLPPQTIESSTLFFAVVRGMALVGIYSNIEDAEAKARSMPGLAAVWRVLPP